MRFVLCITNQLLAKITHARIKHDFHNTIFLKKKRSCLQKYDFMFCFVLFVLFCFFNSLDKYIHRRRDKKRENTPHITSPNTITQTENVACNGKLSDEPPTHTVNWPLTTTNALADALQIDTSLAARVTVAWPVAPGASSSSANPRSWTLGSPAASGKVRYTCAISTPATGPVFFTVKVTVAPAGCRCATTREPYEKVV